NQSIRFGKPWKSIKQTLEAQGLSLDKSRPTRTGRIESCVVRKDMFVASKIHFDLNLEVHVLEPARARRADLTRETDEEQVESASVKLTALVNMPWEEAAKQKGLPKGSVLELILNSDELKAQGRIWPIMKRITVSYAPLVLYASSQTSHAGFEAEVEFI